MVLRFNLIKDGVRWDIGGLSAYLQQTNVAESVIQVRNAAGTGDIFKVIEEDPAYYDLMVLWLGLVPFNYDPGTDDFWISHSVEMDVGPLWLDDDIRLVFGSGSEEYIEHSTVDGKLHIEGHGLAGHEIMVDSPMEVECALDVKFNEGSDSFLRVPQMTTAQLPTPEPGMICFDITTSKFKGWDGTAWRDFH